MPTERYMIIRQQASSERGTSTPTPGNPNGMPANTRVRRATVTLQLLDAGGNVVDAPGPGVATGGQAELPVNDISQWPLESIVEMTVIQPQASEQPRAASRSRTP
jgi:hypothetical protein